MKFIPAISLLVLSSVIGCSSQSEQNAASSNSQLQGSKTAATESIESKEEAKSKPPEAKQQSGSPPSMGYAPGSDRGSAPSETTTQETETASNPQPQTPPETAGGLPIVEKVKELVPVSWLQRTRFWDMANRIIAERNKEPIKLDEKSMKKMALSIDRVGRYLERLNWLHDMLAQRQELIVSEPIDRQLIAAVRGEITLPEGTRERRNRLKTISLPPLTRLGSNMHSMNQAIIEDRLRKGDLLDLVIRLRGSFADYVACRKLEFEQDEFLLSFPTMRLRAIKEFSHMDNNDTTMATARELWADETLKGDSGYMLGGLSPDEISTSFDPTDSGRTAFRVMSDEEFESIRELTEELEQLSGGAGPLLILPEVAELPSRDRLVEASKRNIDAVNDAKIQAIRDVRQHLIDRFDDRAKKMYQRKSDYSEEELKQRFEYLLGRHNLSDSGVVAMIDLAFKFKPNWDDVINAVRKFYPKKYDGFLSKRKQAAFFVGANYYFGQESK